MTTASFWLLKADLRAIAPITGATIALILTGVLSGPFPGIASFAWVAGSVAIGAVVVGHELSDGTLGLLLTQPISRSRLLAIKLLAAGLGVSCVAATALWVGLPSQVAANPFAETAGLLLLVGGSVFVAPVLTMLTRSSLGGLASVLAMPVVLFPAVATSGLLVRPEDGLVGLGLCLAAVCMAAVVGVWWLFGRLEDRAGGGREIHLRFLSGRARSRPLGPIGQIVRKELHLQQLPMVLGAVYVAATIAGAWVLDAPDTRPAGLDPRAVGVVLLYGAAVAVLIGAVASAEERQLGVLPSQHLLPFDARGQFAIKVAVVLALCLVLTVAMPLVLATTYDHPGRFAFRSTEEASLWIGSMSGLTIAGLYTSSISRSGLRAFVATPVLMLAVYPFMAFIVLAIGPALFQLLVPSPQASAGAMARGDYLHRANSIGQVLVSILGVTCAALLTHFAASNHRQPQVGVRDAGMQLVALVGAAVLGTVALVVLFALSAR